MGVQSRSLGCRIKAGSDLGAIGDVHLIARLQVLDEGLHSRVLHVDSVGHAVRAGEGDVASVGCCGDDGYAPSGVDAACPFAAVSDALVPTGGEPGIAICTAIASL